MNSSQNVCESDEPMTFPMLTTFLAFVMLFVIPHGFNIAVTLPLLMLFRTVVFTMPLSRNETHTVPLWISQNIGPPLDFEWI